MLSIFNVLKLFFEDNYRRINVREYARIRKISPPSASKLLKSLEEEGLLKREEERRFMFFYANKQNKLFIKLQSVYYLNKLEEIGLLDYLEKTLLNPIIILFGSFIKAEVNKNSDIDLAIFLVSKKKLDLTKFEEKLNREIQVFQFKDKKEAMKNEELFNNILNGFIIGGSW